MGDSIGGRARGRGRARGQARGEGRGGPGSPNRGGPGASPRGPTPGPSPRGPAPGPPPAGAWGPPPGGPPVGAWGPSPGGPPPAGAWGPSPGGPPAASSWGPRPSQPQQVAPQQAAPSRAQGPLPPAGRARTADLSRPMHEMNIGDEAAGPVGQAGAAAAGGPSLNRGNMRGGARQLPERAVRTRPANNSTKRGNTGMPLRIIANYFKLKTQPKWCLYQYRVDFSPDEERTPSRKTLLGLHRKHIGGYIFDGTVLYTPHRLNPDPLELYSKRNEDGETVKITLKLVGDLSPGDYHYIQVFNILMRRCYESLKLELIGRDYFDPRAKIDIGEYKLQIWPGYKTTIAQYERDILMVAEITHKVIRMETCQDILRKHMHRPGKQGQSDFQGEIIGSIVLTDYNNKTYTVSDVNWDMSPRSTFQQKGNDITFAEYYKKSYNITIRDLNQPLLVVKSKTRDIRAGQPPFINLIPELCRMTGLTPEMRANFQLMRALANHTRVSPEMRISKLLAFNKRLNTTEEVVKDLKTWDMSVEEKLVEFPARQLGPEVLVAGSGSQFTAGDTNDGWTRSMRDNPMFSRGIMNRWVVVVPQRMRREVENFVGMIIKAAAGMSWRIPNPTFCEIPNDSIGVYVSKLEEIAAKVSPNMILCAVTNDKSERYSAIKKKCFVDRGIPSQVLTARCVTNKNAFSIATKIAIQMNCKLGGAPWSMAFPTKATMFVGYDVCHDAQAKHKSYGSIVASLDKSMTRYFSAVTPHTSGEELSNEFGLNIKKACHSFVEFNEMLPTSIIIYRDGVGEGQIPYVFEHEVKVVKAALAEVYKSENYRMIFIIVTKRLNTRFFSASNRSNPKPGTIIDDVVTSPDRYDFFMVSQAVRDGTVSPTSYNVIFDNIGFSPDQLQRITYKMCHMYYNFSGQVRVPATCQYAHKLAFLTGQHLHMSPASTLETFLYFL